MKPVQLQIKIRITLLALSIACAALLLFALIQLVSAQGGGNFTRITTASDSDRDGLSPSLSADGTMVAFMSDSTKSSPSTDKSRARFRLTGGFTSWRIFSGWRNRSQLFQRSKRPR